MSKVMKQFMCVVVLLALLFCCCGCSNKITHGEVYKKEYRRAYTTVMMLPLVISTGKVTTTTIFPYTVHYPERYVIHIKDFNGEEWITEDFYVSKDTFDQVSVGHMFEYDESRGDLTDEPYTKEKKVD